MWMFGNSDERMRYAILFIVNAAFWRFSLHFFLFDRNKITFFEFYLQIFQFNLGLSVGRHRWMFGTQSNEKWICVFSSCFAVFIVMHWLPHTNNRNMNICYWMQPWNLTFFHPLPLLLLLLIAYSHSIERDAKDS